MTSLVSPLYFSRLSLAVLACLVIFWAVFVDQSLGAEAGSPLSADPATIEALIRQLGSDDYEQREAAGKQILEIGLPALPIVERHSHSEDFEIRYRCERLRLILNDTDLDRRFEAFAKDEKDETDYDIPGWKTFRDRFGKLDGAKALFVEMFRDDKELMVKHAEKSNQLGRIAQARAIEVQQDQQRQKGLPKLGRLAALVYAQPDASTADLGPFGPQLNQMVIQYCGFGPISEAMNSGPHKEPVRALVSQRIEAAEGWEFQQAAWIAINHDIKSILKPARKMIENKANGQQHMLPSAMMVISKFGTDDDLLALESLVEEKHVVSNWSRNGGPNRQGQVGDAAMATILKMMKKDLKDFGVEGDGNSGPNQSFNPQMVGFEDEPKRQAAREKFKEALTEWKKERGLKVEEKPAEAQPADPKPDNAAAAAEAAKAAAKEAIRQALDDAFEE